MSKQQRFTALFMIVVFELEFVPQADVYKTANYLRTLGITATVVDNDKDKIIIEEESYNKALEKLTPIVPELPDIFRFTWRNGSAESVLYEVQRIEKFINDSELVDSLKVVPGFDEKARLTIVLREDKNTIIKYQNTVRKIENMGFKVTFADGFIDAGWMTFPAIDIEISNNIAAFREALIKLTDIPEVNRFLYNRGKNPHINEYTISFEDGADFEKQISKILANGIEVYKIDKLLNKIFIHFPQNEVQNKYKLEQIKSFEGLVVIKNLHENQHQFVKPEYSRNLNNVWLDVPVEILNGSRDNDEYAKALTGLAREEVKRLQQKGMIVLHYGLYVEMGEVLLPEVVFTYRDIDSPKAEELTSKSKKKPAPEKTPKGPVHSVNICAQLFR
ncbi:MAG: hypothetical protein V4596_12285 [Bdellovibrionota bacterium]